MTIKRLAFLEGKISVRLLLIITISILLLVAIEFSLNNEEAYDEAIIFRTLESLGFSVTTIFLIFLPKVVNYIYVHCKNYVVSIVAASDVHLVMFTENVSK